jgi:hypothetical protein
MAEHESLDKVEFALRDLLDTQLAHIQRSHDEVKALHDLE